MFVCWTYWIGISLDGFIKILIGHLRNHLETIEKVSAERTCERGQKLPAALNHAVQVSRSCSGPARHARVTLGFHVAGDFHARLGVLFARLSLSRKRNARSLLKFMWWRSTKQQTETAGCCCRLRRILSFELILGMTIQIKDIEIIFLCSCLLCTRWINLLSLWMKS